MGQRGKDRHTERDGLGWGDGPVHVVIWGCLFLWLLPLQVQAAVRASENRVRVQIFCVDRKLLPLAPERSCPCQQRRQGVTSCATGLNMRELNKFCLDIKII